MFASFSPCLTPWETTMGTELDYPFRVRPLSKEEGGGYLIEFPDLPGCMSDGETIEEAVANGADALRSCSRTMREFGDPLPPPSRPKHDDAYRGRWQRRGPPALHGRLPDRARADGLRRNT